MNNYLYIFFFLIFLFNFFFFININNLIKLFSIYDLSKSNLKNKKSRPSLIGGTIIFLNIIFYLLLNKIFSFDYFIDQFSILDFLIFFFIFSSFYIVGLYDDKYKISPLSRLFFLGIIILVAILLDSKIIISSLRFSFVDNNFQLKNFSILFTVICFLLFTNALNMFDGINLQSITYSLIIFLFILLNSNFIFFSISIITSLMFIYYYNYKNKIYIGDSGVYILSSIISYILVYEYNYKDANIFADDIFILMMIPGLDFTRIFIERIIKRKHPFKGDKNHIHHLLLKKIGFIKTYLVISFLYIIPVLLLQIKINNLLIIFTFTFLYLLIYFKFRSSNKFFSVNKI